MSDIFNESWNNSIKTPELRLLGYEEGTILIDLSGSTDWDPKRTGYNAKRIYGKIISKMHSDGVFKKAKKWHIVFYGSTSEYIGCKVAALVNATLTRTLQRNQMGGTWVGRAYQDVVRHCRNTEILIEFTDGQYSDQNVKQIVTDLHRCLPKLKKHELWCCVPDHISWSSMNKEQIVGQAGSRAIEVALSLRKDDTSVGLDAFGVSISQIQGSTVTPDIITKSMMQSNNIEVDGQVFQVPDDNPALVIYDFLGMAIDLVPEEELDQYVVAIGIYAGQRCIHPERLTQKVQDLLCQRDRLGCMESFMAGVTEGTEEGGATKACVKGFQNITRQARFDDFNAAKSFINDSGMKGMNSDQHFVLSGRSLNEVAQHMHAVPVECNHTGCNGKGSSLDLSENDGKEDTVDVFSADVKPIHVQTIRIMLRNWAAKRLGLDQRSPDIIFAVMSLLAELLSHGSDGTQVVTVRRWAIFMFQAPYPKGRGQGYTSKSRIEAFAKGHTDPNLQKDFKKITAFSNPFNLTLKQFVDLGRAILLSEPDLLDHFLPGDNEYKTDLRNSGMTLENFATGNLPKRPPIVYVEVEPLPECPITLDVLTAQMFGEGDVFKIVGCRCTKTHLIHRSARRAIDEPNGRCIYCRANKVTHPNLATVVVAEVPPVGLGELRSALSAKKPIYKVEAQDEESKESGNPKDTFHLQPVGTTGTGKSTFSAVFVQQVKDFAEQSGREFFYVDTPSLIAGLAPQPTPGSVVVIEMSMDKMTLEDPKDQFNKTNAERRSAWLKDGAHRCATLSEAVLDFYRNIPNSCTCIFVSDIMAHTASQKLPLVPSIRVDAHKVFELGFRPTKDDAIQYLAFSLDNIGRRPIAEENSSIIDVCKVTSDTDVYRCILTNGAKIAEAEAQGASYKTIKRLKARPTVAQQLAGRDTVEAFGNMCSEDPARVAVLAEQWRSAHPMDETVAQAASLVEQIMAIVDADAQVAIAQADGIAHVAAAAAAAGVAHAGAAAAGVAHAAAAGAAIAVADPVAFVGAAYADVFNAVPQPPQGNDDEEKEAEDYEWADNGANAAVPMGLFNLDVPEDNGGGADIYDDNGNGQPAAVPIWMFH